jgi:predicted AAA+ superfamily ATPase
MKRYLDQLVLKDLHRKMVIVTGPRQVGKTTLAKHCMPQFDRAQYFNWDVAQDRRILIDQSWRKDAGLLVLDEIHKRDLWKNWLKGVVDGRPSSQALLVTGSARMDTFRHTGESLAGRFFSYRLHPFSVKEWCAVTGAEPSLALAHLIERGGFPEPCTADSDEDANRWRSQYLTGLVRDDVLEFSRLREVGAMRLFVELLRDRVGSPLSLNSIARDLAISPATVSTYLEILQALFIVFTIHPWHRNIARALLKTPKVYFYDTGLVRGDEGVRLENAMATMLQKHAHFLQDSAGREVDLHYLRTKDGVEVDFVLSEKQELTHLIECKASDDRLHSALARFAKQFPDAAAVQAVGQLRQQQEKQGVLIVDAASWLAELAA